MFDSNTVIPHASGRRCALACLLALALATGGAANAQDADSNDPFAGVEEMVVTGSSAAALLEAPNPSSVISFDTQDLEAIGAADVSDVAAFTPNLEIKTSSSTAATFFIRGVGLADFSANATGSVGVAYDGVPMNSSAQQLGQLFDIQNFSVLKGPQSGAAGRNASAGAIQITSRQPGFEHAGNLLVSVGQFNTVDAIDAPQYNIEGGFDTPIIPDVLTSRIAFTFKGQEPYITNRCGGLPPIPERNQRRRGLCNEVLGIRTPGQPPRPPFGVEAFLPTEVGQSFDMGGRAILKWLVPDTETAVTLNVHGRSRRQDSTVGEAIGTGSDGTSYGGGTVSGYIPAEITGEFRALGSSAALAKNLARDRPLDKRPFDGDYNRIGQTRLDSYGGYVKVESTIGDIEIKSTTSADYYDRWRSADNDFTPDVLFESITNDKAWQFVQDLRFTGTFDDFPLEWEAGAIYVQEDLYSRVNQAIEVPAIVRFVRTYTQGTQAAGAYAHFTLDLLESFQLQAGARYNWERKEFDIQQDGPNPLPTACDEARTWSAPTGAVSLTYDITEEIDVFWKYSRGFKAGHFNANNTDCEAAGPEDIDAFEIGMNATGWAQRVRMSAALFNYAYQDYQVFVFQDEFANPPSLVIRNADNARVFGADADVTVQPLIGFVPEWFENLSVTLRVGWLETRFLRFTQLQPRLRNNRPVELVEDNSGNPLINSPRFKVSGTLTWEFILDGVGSFTPRYDFTWTDDAFFDPAEGRGSLNGNGVRGNPKFRTGQPAYLLHNIRLTYTTPDGNISMAAWCRNVTDTRYKTAAFDVSAFSKVTINFVGDPRSCGGELKLTW